MYFGFEKNGATDSAGIESAHTGVVFCVTRLFSVPWWFIFYQFSDGCYYDYFFYFMIFPSSLYNRCSAENIDSLVRRLFVSCCLVFLPTPPLSSQNLFPIRSQLTIKIVCFLKMSDVCVIFNRNIFLRVT